MCGIAGVIGGSEGTTRDAGTRLLMALAHRGPDGEGLVQRASHGRSIVLAHRRLAIIDLSDAGAQPMTDEATGNVVTFNGEIYNHRALRVELESRGCVFRSNSDTEVMLHAYAQWGMAFVERLRGMFAFALWDARNERLVCAVDRFGIKPLYYTEQGGAFAVASEVRALLHAGVVRRELDASACVEFFVYGSVQSSRTIVRDVRALLPAHTLIYDTASHTCTTSEYWTPSARMPMTTPDDVAAALQDTVRNHLVSDVPLGLFLSGGVDSSALCVLAHREAASAVHAHTITFEEAAYAEGAIARQVGERFCASYTETMLTATDVLAMLPDVLRAMDQPTIDGVNAYAISKTIRAHGLKAVLSGQGGDEVFGGYPSFRRLPSAWKFACLHGAVPEPLRRAYAPLVSRAVATGEAQRKLVQLVAERHTSASVYALSRQLFAPAVIARLLPEAPAMMTLPRAQEADTAFSAVSLYELRGYLANTLLRDGDVMSMAHGLEVRVPYVDHVLLETVLALPRAQKVDATLPKIALLRHVLDELPPDVYRRNKSGFTFPWEFWLRGEMRGMLEETFGDDEAAVCVGLNLSVVRELYRTFLDGRDGVTWSRVWAPFVLLKWVRRTVLDV